LDRLHFSVTSAGAARRLDHFLHAQLPAYSRARLQDWIRQGRILVNGAGRRASYVLRTGDFIEVDPAELAPLRATAEEPAWWCTPVRESIPARW
jgi:23S rRNA pseudouridine1911/1915/1917 synthase